MKRWLFIAFVFVLSQGAQCYGGNCCSLRAVFGSWIVELPPRTPSMSNAEVCPIGGDLEVAFLSIVGANGAGQFTFDFVELEPTPPQSENGDLRLANCTNASSDLMIEDGWLESYAECDRMNSKISAKIQVYISGLLTETLDSLDNATVEVDIWRDGVHVCEMLWEESQIEQVSE